MDVKNPLKRKHYDDEPSPGASKQSNKRKLEENLSDESDDESPKRKINNVPSFNPKTSAASAVSSSELSFEIRNAFKNDDLFGSKLDDSKSNAKSADNSSASNNAMKMMMKMGYQDGTGLGKKSQGIVKPVEESNQQGKHGLGFRQKNFEKRIEYWEDKNDVVSAIETPVWLDNNDDPVPSSLELKKWKKIGKKKRILDDEDKFCSKETLKQVLDCKSIFDNLDDRDMRNARSRANPYEAIGSRFFQNRAALKMANIDAVFNFMFTDPKTKDEKSKIEPNEPLYFCDICAGPGGFSEYVLWRKKWRAKGFGFTLRGDNDFKLDDFLAGAPEYFEPFYGVNGLNGDGDITRSDNLKEFQKLVVDQTNHRGAHFVMADGGFSVEGNENIQEILSKQLYLCQFLCALSVLRTGGNFVCKLFDLFTPFSVGLVYLMYLCFDRICIHKPVTSRPANSERYIICEGAKEVKSIIYNYLFDINDSLNKTFRDEKLDSDVESIVPIEYLLKNKPFFDYIFNSNESIGKIQVLNLKKIQAFATNKNLYDTRQSQLIEDCLKYWRVPNETRLIYADDSQMEELQKMGFYKRQKAKINSKPIEHEKLLVKFSEQLRKSISIYDVNSMIPSSIRELTNDVMSENFKNCSIFDYQCAMACGNLVFLIGCGGSNVYEFELNSTLNSLPPSKRHSIVKNWKLLDWVKIELPKETFLLAEKVVEYRGLEEKQIESKAIHVIDGYFLGGENLVSSNSKITSLQERHESLKVFIKSVTKKSRNDLAIIRLKDIFGIPEIKEMVLENLVKKVGKEERDYENGIHIPLSFASEYYIYPTGLYLFKYIESPWSICKSKSTGKNYYFNSENKRSSYVVPDDSPRFYSTPKYYLDRTLAWKWPKVDEDEYNDYEMDNATNHVITKKKFLDFISNYL